MDTEKTQMEAPDMNTDEAKTEENAAETAATPGTETTAEAAAGTDADPKAEAAASETDPKAETAKEADEAPSADAAEAKPDEAGKPADEAKPEQPDWKDRYARAMADFDNFRKRTARDREDLVKFAAKDVIKDVLATVDNLARALEGAKDRADDPFVKGVQLVYDGLLKTLADHGATPLDSVGEPFDTNYHEALTSLPSEDVEEGIVMNEVQRGWLLHGKSLRPAKVVVSKGKGA